MSDVMEAIYNRRAVRKYRSNSVERKWIDQILDAGRMAPSAMNLQPWRFIVLTEQELIDDMDDQVSVVVKEIYTQPHMAEFLKKRHPIFHSAPVVIFITAPRTNEWAALDVGMCAQNIMLAAKVFGLDSCPIGLGKFIERTSLYSQLEIPRSEHVLISLTLGYADEEPPVPERKKNNVTYVRAGVTSRI